MGVVYQLFISLCLFLIFINFLNNLRHLRRSTTRNGSRFKPLVSVLVPARNEEHNIYNCLKSLINQDYPSLEILVLDDNSTDQTPSIVRSLAREFPNVRLLTGNPLPDGWTGKNFACHQLALMAKGEWLLFTDADTVHKPNSIAIAIGAVEKSGSMLLSLLPRPISGTIGEALFMPLIPFAFLCFLPFGLINRSKDERISAALGPFILINRDFYFEIGGHAAISGEVVDDIQLAQLTKRSGGRIELIDGFELVSVRFYQGLKQVWAGFSKNAYGAIGASPYIALGFLFLGALLFILPYYLFITGLIHGYWFWFPAIQVSMITLIRTILAIRFRMSFLLALLHPVSALLGLLVGLNSTRLAIGRKAIEWKERVYPISN